MFETLRMNDVNRTREHSLDISGKGINVTRVLTQLGERVIHLTHAGGALAPFFLERARQEGLTLQAIATSAPLRVCVTLLQKQGSTTTEIVEDGYTVDAKTEARIRRTFSRLLPKCRAVIITGSKTDGYSDSLLPDLVRLTRLSGKPVICDFRGTDLVNSLPFAPDVIKPNVTEFTATFFPACDRHARDQGMTTMVKEKMRQLWCEHHVVTVLTDGSRPVFYTDGNDIGQWDPPLVEPVNTTGCGDAFTAGFAQAYLASSSVPDAVKAGTRCAVQNALLLRPGIIRQP